MVMELLHRLLSRLKLGMFVYWITDNVLNVLFSMQWSWELAALQIPYPIIRSLAFMGVWTSGCKGSFVQSLVFIHVLLTTHTYTHINRLLWETELYTIAMSDICPPNQYYMLWTLSWDKQRFCKWPWYNVEGFVLFFFCSLLLLYESWLKVVLMKGGPLAASPPLCLVSSGALALITLFAGAPRLAADMAPQVLPFPRHPTKHQTQYAPTQPITLWLWPTACAFLVTTENR